MIAIGNWPTIGSEHIRASYLGFSRLAAATVTNSSVVCKSLGISFADVRSIVLCPIRVMEVSKTLCGNDEVPCLSQSSLHSDDKLSGNDPDYENSNGCMSTNIVWHNCSVEKIDRQELLNQKGCVVWFTGLSGSGKSTVACALSRGLHAKGKLTYILDGDNVRHGLNRDLTFKTEDRAENIRRIGEVAKLFADSGVICIASLISPYIKDRDACRILLPQGDFIEVFIDVPLQICEARDPKGLYKLARLGKIKGFTGIDDPYERPVNCEITLVPNADGICESPEDMAGKVISYLEENGYLRS